MANPFVSVINLGCRVNRVESDRITLELAREGFTLVDPDEAELIIIGGSSLVLYPAAGLFNYYLWYRRARRHRPGGKG